MKTNSIIVIVFTMLLAFACNNQQRKESESNSSVDSKPIVEKSGIKKTDKAEQEEFQLCDSIVTEILITSPRYKKLTKGLSKAVIKNGGLSFGIRLEGSPNPNRDKSCSYSETYDFTLYEMYTDRKLNTARFSFHPNDKQLYEFDEVQNQIEPIEFDKALLLKYDTLCK